MIRIKMKTISIFVLFVMGFLSFSMQTFAAGSLEEQEKALKIIADFADRMCKDIPLQGQGNNLELTGSAKAELNGIISKIAKLGVEGAVKYQDTEYEGLLQKDIVRALKDSTDCRLQVWKDLKDSLLTPESKIKKDSLPSKNICNQNTLTKESANFIAVVDGFSQKGKTVNISVSVTNKTGEDIKVSLFRQYAILVNPLGETQAKSGNRHIVLIKSQEKESFSYNFSFKDDFKDGTFDFTLKFEKPSSNFAFFGISNECF